MPNKLTFTNPINLPALKYARVTLASEIDDTAKRLVLELEISGDDVVHPTRHRLEVTNNGADTLEVNPTPSNITDTVRSGRLAPTTPASEGTPAVYPPAFDRVMFAYMSAAAQGGDGNGAILSELQELGILPEGEVS